MKWVGSISIGGICNILGEVDHMEDAFREKDAVWRVYEVVGPGDVLQQGDLIKFSESEKSSFYGIVVTADCDLDNRKHSRLVTLVPLLTVEGIICSCLAYDAFEHHRDILQQFCRKSMGIEEVPADPKFTGKVKALLREGGIEDKSTEIAAKAIAHEELRLSVADVKLALEAAGVSWSKTLERFRKQIDSRGDLLRLTKPPLTEQNVTVAWFRSMWQEQVSSIAVRTSEASSRKGVRVAQLNSPFRYRLTQMLGQVFADIGLPELSVNSINNDFKGLDS